MLFYVNNKEELSKNLIKTSTYRIINLVKIIGWTSKIICNTVRIKKILLKSFKKNVENSENLNK